MVKVCMNLYLATWELCKSQAKLFIVLVLFHEYMYFVMEEWEMQSTVAKSIKFTIRAYWSVGKNANEHMTTCSCFFLQFLFKLHADV